MNVLTLSIGILIAIAIDLLIRRTKGGFMGRDEEAMFMVGVIIIVYFLLSIFGPAVFR